MTQHLNYTVILEKETTSYGAYVPDLPGCVAVGETQPEVLQLIHEAIVFHLEDLQSRGNVIPEPYSTSTALEIAIA
ncbi:MAG: type II toxin-antitoxin system HicB family antitoxin [Spirulina sp. SIO3F2]|nr:type II toxin-antitoxin system HicB family antitoxin [Spirulina sp. SIO3F2]